MRCELGGRFCRNCQLLLRFLRLQAVLTWLQHNAEGAGKLRQVQRRHMPIVQRGLLSLCCSAAVLQAAPC